MYSEGLVWLLYCIWFGKNGYSLVIREWLINDGLLTEIKYLYAYPCRCRLQEWSHMCEGDFAASIAAAVLDTRFGIGHALYDKDCNRKACHRFPIHRDGHWSGILGSVSLSRIGLHRQLKRARKKGKGLENQKLESHSNHCEVLCPWQVDEFKFRRKSKAGE